MRGDRRLVRRFLRGDEAAFRRLYGRHTPALLQLALRLVGGRESEAEDVVQEAWIRAAESLGGFGWRSELRTWLKGITINCSRELLRRRWVRRTAALEEVQEVAHDREPPGAATLLDLERAIAALPDELRVAFVLFAVEGRSHNEIAVLLGIRPGTSKSRVSRARRRVRERLTTKEAVDDEPDE